MRGKLLQSIIRIQNWLFHRYQEGRKLWTTIQVTSRNLAQLVRLLCFTERNWIQKIWIHIPDERPPSLNSTVLQNVIEKKSMVNLVRPIPPLLLHPASLTHHLTDSSILCCSQALPQRRKRGLLWRPLSIHRVSSSLRRTHQPWNDRRHVASLASFRRRCTSIWPQCDTHKPIPKPFQYRYDWEGRNQVDIQFLVQS